MPPTAKRVAKVLCVKGMCEGFNRSIMTVCFPHHGAPPRTAPAPARRGEAPAPLLDMQKNAREKPSPAFSYSDLLLTVHFQNRRFSYEP